MIKNITNKEISKINSENLTPSAEIDTPERLYGREKNLLTIERAFNSKGRIPFVYGDRGVGKSSLAKTAAYLKADSGNHTITVVCSQDDTFSQVVKSIGDATLNIKNKFERKGVPGTYQASVLGNGAAFSPSGETITNIKHPTSLNEALDIFRFILANNPGNIVIIVDEMERISNVHEREKFSELIKNIPLLDERIKFIFCGIGTTLNELVGNHPSAGRVIESVEVEKLHHNHLWKIIETVADALSLDIEKEALIRISQISDGFPSYVHLIGDSMFWNAFDDDQITTKIKAKHFEAGISGALERSEATLKQQYFTATAKTKHTADYEEALWALADTTSDRRQLSEIYNSSYMKIMKQRKDRSTLEQSVFNRRLHSLKKTTHGEIIKNHGAGWWEYRENIIRGYVRLKAANAGITLGNPHVMRSV